MMKSVALRSNTEMILRFRPNCEPAKGSRIRIPIRINIPNGSSRANGAESEEAPFSFAIILQVAKSARALVSARRAIIISAALTNLASGLFAPISDGSGVGGYIKK